VPIYEFYCPDCHTVFSFLARRPSAKRPACPRCRRPRLERRASRFAISSGRPEPTADEGPGAADEARMESALAEMAADAEKIDESNPRQMAGFMRSFFQRTGMPMGHGVEEAIRRMEAGEDPDRIEEEMGDLLDGAGPDTPEPEAAGLRRLRRALASPRVDETLYEM
jgi:putative FmdB family regulatory protein